MYDDISFPKHIFDIIYRKKSMVDHGSVERVVTKMILVR